MKQDIISAAEAVTLYGLLKERARRSPKATGYRQFNKASGSWEAYTWPQALERADGFAAAFAAEGISPGDRVALLLPNCLDWICFDMGAAKLGLPVVPLYTNDAVTNTAFLIADARPRIVFVDTVARWKAISEALSDTSFIDRVWIQESDADAGRSGHVERLDTVLARAGQAQTGAHDDPNVPATLIYTSGTTGNPKGAMLNHAAILSNAEGVYKGFPSLPSDTFLSILPLAHAFERTMGYILAMMGGSCTAYCQSVLRLRQDLTTIRPTVLMGVPRLYESIYSAARTSAAASPVRLKMFDMTARIGWQRFAKNLGIHPGPSFTDRLIWPVLERLVGRKVRNAFGGRLRVAVSGGANFPAEIGQALVGLGIPMVEGYGLTEAGPVATYSTCPQYMPGSVGFPVDGVEIRKGDKGELQLRSRGQMSGYWHREDATAAVLDAEGWLSTGDLVEIRDDGRIVIAGRLKHILVMSNGENVNPVPIEDVLEADTLFDQVCTVGDGRPFLSLLVVLNKDAWAALAEKEGLDPERPNIPAAEKVIMPRIKAHMKPFAPHQQIKAYHAALEEWSIERGLLTPTLKLKREKVVAEYEAEIREIYARGSRGE
ncbi:long-chain acyl-CoA synthetase [Aliiruegeria haliotis]|uniref:Long-chain acyl-CoA synthetase n=1 Tax=Aliiruegeria haliotis TaxID=1280846 RepID=A0A2T0RRB5_9RHOB|nr:AMP-binding protein [Aliiruegeria haliotis]PRY23633.1 long-chain acyl-CoA synthetase [Aliiruegeria haliotis]